MWAKQSNFFGEVPYNLLLSSVKHPHLTVDRLFMKWLHLIRCILLCMFKDFNLIIYYLHSEMHISDALLLWLESNMENLETRSEAEDNCNGILKQVSLYVSLLILKSWIHCLAESCVERIYREKESYPMKPLFILLHL
jgi:hypothetical protein